MSKKKLHSIQKQPKYSIRKPHLLVSIDDSLKNRIAFHRKLDFLCLTYRISIFSLPRQLVQLCYTHLCVNLSFFSMYVDLRQTLFQANNTCND